MTSYVRLITAFLVAATFGCDTGPKSSRGFRLPDGDIEKGKIAFVELECNSCHTMEGVELPTPEEAAPRLVDLGGEVSRLQTYGELVTSIINPSHDIASSYPKTLISITGESPMTNFNEVMTVQQMIDLVAFLQSGYQLAIPQYPTAP